MTIFSTSLLKENYPRLFKDKNEKNKLNICNSMKRKK
jgi:hypothetical protein